MYFELANSPVRRLVILWYLLTVHSFMTFDGLETWKRFASVENHITFIGRWHCGRVIISAIEITTIIIARIPRFIASRRDVSSKAKRFRNASDYGRCVIIYTVRHYAIHNRCSPTTVTGEVFVIISPSYLTTGQIRIYHFNETGEQTICWRSSLTYFLYGFSVSL